MNARSLTTDEYIVEIVRKIDVPLIAAAVGGAAPVPPHYDYDFDDSDDDDDMSVDSEMMAEYYIENEMMYDSEMDGYLSY